MNNRNPAPKTVEPAQLRKTLRDVLRPAYACAEAPQCEYANQQFVELAARAAARDKSLHVTSTTNGRLLDSATSILRRWWFKYGAVYELHWKPLERLESG